MAIRTLDKEIKENGVDQRELVRLLRNIVDVVNELVDDHAAFQLAVDGICQKLDADSGVGDTDYEATHGIGGSGAALPATLTNSTDLTLNKG